MAEKGVPAGVLSRHAPLDQPSINSRTNSNSWNHGSVSEKDPLLNEQKLITTINALMILFFKERVSQWHWGDSL